MEYKLSPFAKIKNYPSNLFKLTSHCWLVHPDLFARRRRRRKALGNRFSRNKVSERSQFIVHGAAVGPRGSKQVYLRTRAMPKTNPRGTLAFPVKMLNN